MTITEFLAARLDEDEAVALGMLAEPPGMTVSSATFAPFHYERHFNPGRVLAEVEAKRRIVERYEEAHMVAADMRSLDLGPERTSIERARYSAREGVYYEVLLHAAQVYADHPDYDEAWRP